MIDHVADYDPGKIGQDPETPLIIFVPPCPDPKCSDCDQQFRSITDQRNLSLRYRASLSDQQARIILAKLVSSINRDLLYLRSRCAARGNAIMSRWKKKSREKREKLLLTADPDLYPEQWLIPGHLWKFGANDDATLNKDWPKLRKRHNSYLLPYMTIPNLRDDPSKFLSLLLNRTRFSPEEWAPFDNKQLRTGWFSPVFNVDFIEGSVLMHGSRYGQLTQWDRLAAERWESVGFPRGKLILEAQEHMMAFLRKVVEQLLEGSDNGSDAASDKWNEFSITGFKFTSSAVHWSEFLNQPFSSPPTFNISKLLSIAQTQMDDAADHFWLLQTDPTYMRREMRIVGQDHIKQSSTVPDSHYNGVSMQLWLDFDRLLEWSWVRDECQHVKDIVARFSDSIGPGAALPPKVDRALGALELLVVNRLHHRRQELQARYLEAPSFRHYCSTLCSDMPKIKDQKLDSWRYDLLREDPLNLALISLWTTNPEVINEVDHIVLYSLLDDHLTKSSSTERGRITERLYNSITATAALQEIMSAIRLNRPLNVCRYDTDCYANEDRKSWRWLAQYNMSDVDKKVVRKPHPFEEFPNQIKELGCLLKGFEAVPLPVVGRPDQSWINSFENRHAALSAFWDCFRALWRKHKNRYDISKEDVEDDLEMLRADTKPEHLQALQAEKAKLLARIAAPSTTAQPTGHIQTEWAHQEADPLIVSIRSKKKTRPEDLQLPFPDQVEIPVENLSLADVPAAAKIAVKQQTFNILTAMFRSSNKKEYDWEAFVAAMNDAGFPATHTGTGSAVSFEADESRCPWKGKINFHKPHPVAKIDFVMLHAMGKRMKKWFGWDESTFEVEVSKSA